MFNSIFEGDERSSWEKRQKMSKKLKAQIKIISMHFITLKKRYLCICVIYFESEWNERYKNVWAFNIWSANKLTWRTIFFIVSQLLSFFFSSSTFHWWSTFYQIHKRGFYVAIFVLNFCYSCMWVWCTIFI